MSRHIYTDEDTDLMIEQLLKINKNYNFSDLFKKSVKEVLEKINTNDVVYLNNMLNEYYNKRSEAEDGIKHYKKLLEDLSKKETKKKLEKEEQINKALSEHEQRIKDFSESISDLWCDLRIPEDVIKNLAEDFYMYHFKKKSLFDYMKEMGYETDTISPESKVKEVKEKDITITESVINKEYEDLMKIAAG